MCNQYRWFILCTSCVNLFEGLKMIRRSIFFRTMDYQGDLYVRWVKKRDKRCYYENSNTSRQEYLIELYNMGFQSQVDSEQENFTYSRIARSMNIDGWWYTHPGKLKNFNVFQARPQTPYATLHFNYNKRVL